MYIFTQKDGEVEKSACKWREWMNGWVNVNQFFLGLVIPLQRYIPISQEFLAYTKMHIEKDYLNTKFITMDSEKDTVI